MVGVFFTATWVALHTAVTPQLPSLRIPSRTRHAGPILGAVVVEPAVLRMAVLALSDGQKMMSCGGDWGFLKKGFLILCLQGENFLEDCLLGANPKDSCVVEVKY